MRFTIVTGFAALAATGYAIPVTQRAPGAATDTHMVTMKREDFMSLGKRSGLDGPISESVNYILVLFKDDDDVDPYQEEIDSYASPADVLG
ncbi:hypothetical protein N0V93_001403 [Gnomoniopsis smithogilvyi]|uniref:Uncharacterized protein n=1 Tax=Gnomoniopsis smithogilvyi TaxID=1191159 RepID=A0A9W8Z213_9PEZI|nr:hypothetical protein N0V93_001403 [Gnomoniopsis smithogilvyi]